MQHSNTNRSWTRHFVCRSARTRTTWKFRFSLVGLAAIALWLTSHWWTTAVARSLTCDPNPVPSDAILVENFNFPYLAFEHAANLRQAGFAARVLVPVTADPGTSEPNDVALGTTQVMVRIAGLGSVDIVPIQEVEPVSLNAARDVLRYVEHEGIRSVLVVSPLFRSRRSALVYAATLGRAGIALTCSPARGTHGVDTWTRSQHGIQDVVQQWLKLQYYRLYVLPFRSDSATSIAHSEGH